MGGKNSTEAPNPPELERAGENSQHSPPPPENNGITPPPEWMIEESAVLCDIVYGSDSNTILHDLKESFSSINEISISDDFEYEGKVLIAERPACDGQPPCVFLAFRGTQNLPDALADVNVFPARGDLGLYHKGFFDRTHAFRLNYLMKICKDKVLVVTGHSLGGACASILTSRFISQYVQYDLLNRVYCITFGCPLVAFRTVANSMSLYKGIFHHYIMKNDIVPVALSLPKALLKSGLLEACKDSFQITGMAWAFAAEKILSVLTDFYPFGNYYMLNIEEGRGECNHLLPTQVKAHFSANVPDFANIESTLSEHGMKVYLATLTHSVLLTHPPSTNNPKRSLTLTARRPEVIFCNFTDRTLDLYGNSLEMLTKCNFEGKLLRVAQSNEEMASFSLPDGPEKEEISKRYKSQVEIATLQIFTFFGQSLEIPNIPIKMKHRKEGGNYPNEIIGSVLPLTTLLERNEQSGAFHVFQFNQLGENLRAIENSIPVEFAFSIMARRSIIDNQEDNVFLFEFLKRVAEVTILDWKKLCSLYMMEILDKSIKNLKDFEEPAQLEKLQLWVNAAFGRAFRSSITQFDRYLWVENQEIGCQFYFSGEPRTNSLYWEFIVQEAIPFGINFDFERNPPDGAKIVIDGAEWEVQLDDFCDWTVGTSHLLNEKVYFLKNLATNEKRTFRYFTQVFYLSEEAKPTPFLLTILITFFQKIWDQQMTTPIHIQANERTMEIAQVFTLIWLISIDKEKKFIDHKGFVEKYFEKTLQHDSFPKLSLENWKPLIIAFIKLPAVSDRISSNKNNFNLELDKVFGFRRDPRSRVLAKLEHLQKMMKINYDRVTAPVFCGLSITMPVLHGNQETPFFRIIPPENVKQHEKLTINSDVVALKFEMVESARKASKGIKFLLLMLNDMMIGSDAELRLETPVDSRLAVVGNVGKAVLDSVKVSIWGAMKTIRFLGNRDFGEIVDVDARFYALWHSVYYKGESFNCYEHLLRHLASQIGIGQNSGTTIGQLEAAIALSVPTSMRNRSIGEILKDTDGMFRGTKFEAVMNKRSKAVCVFFLKLIYHSYHIKRIRDNITLVSINGQTNAGKTSLVKKLVGKGPDGNWLVQDPIGRASHQTTIFPKPYHVPNFAHNVAVLDLPGISDADTRDTAAMFASSSDLYIFVINATNPKNPVDPSMTMLASLIQYRNGPMLVCINQFDSCIDEQTSADDIPKVMKNECEAWSKSSCFGLRDFMLERAPRWKCEKDKAGAIVHSTSSGVNNMIPVSIWLTCFDEGYVRRDEVVNQIFNISHVRDWIQEAMEWFNSQYVPTLHN